MNQISLKQGMSTVDDMQIKSPTEQDMTPILHKPYTYSVHNEAQLTVVSKASANAMHNLTNITKEFNVIENNTEDIKELCCIAAYYHLVKEWIIAALYIQS